MRLLFVFITLLTSSIIYGQTKTLLIARNSGEKVLSDGRTIKSMGFATKLSENPGIPGPTLEYYEGDSVTIDLWNVSQGAPHTIHLHGLDVDQQNDGVPHLSFTVEHMQHGFYRFLAPHPGTYLYHCHVVSAIHVQGGMYGMLIVKPKNEVNKTWSNGFSFANDYNFIFSEIDTIWHHDSVMNHSTDHMQVKIPEYRPSYFLCNGLSGGQLLNQKINLIKGEQTYLRLANIGYLGNRITWPNTAKVTIIDSDGRPLPNPYQSDTLHIFPGERYGLLMESSVLVHDSVKVEYLDMNTLIAKGELYLNYSVVDDLKIKKVHKPKFKLYPNPSEGRIVIEFENNQPMVVAKITSAMGQVLDIKTASNTSRLIFDLTVDKALYFIEIVTENGEKTVVKVLLK